MFTSSHLSPVTPPAFTPTYAPPLVVTPPVTPQQEAIQPTIPQSPIQPTATIPHPIAFSLIDPNTHLPPYTEPQAVTSIPTDVVPQNAPASSYASPFSATPPISHPGFSDLTSTPVSPPVTQAPVIPLSELPVLLPTPVQQTPVSIAVTTETGAEKFYPLTNDADYYQQFESEISNPPKVIPTEFPQFNHFLKGGLRPGLIGFGAISSLGKTTYMMQVVDFAAASGRDVLIFTLEMTRKELVAKSISRLTVTLHNEFYHKNGDFPHGTTATDILDNRCRYFGDYTEQDFKMKIYFDALKRFRESIAPNRFIAEPIARCSFSNIESEINTFLTKRQSQIEEKGKPFFPPIIAVDYLQTIAPDDKKKDIRQHIDEVVLNLKILSKKLQTPIFVISSFNRFMYNKEVSYESFKESGGIEYTADCLLGFNPICINEGNKRIRPGDSKYSYNLAKSRNPRIVELVILKNRYGETTGENGIFYEYFPAFNFFREIPNVDGSAQGWNPNASREQKDVSGQMVTLEEKGNRVTSDEY